MEPLQIIGDKISSWLKDLISMLPNLFIAILILLTTYFLVKLVKKIMLRILGQVSSHKPVNVLISNIIAFVVAAIGIYITLSTLQLDKTVTSLLAGAGIVALALSLAFQDLASNFVAGVLIALRRPFQLNDIIETNDHFGKVDKINLRTTDLLTFQGQIVLIPNKEVFENPIVNYSSTGFRRIDLNVGISYGDNLEKVKNVTLDAVNSCETIDKTRNVDLYFKEFGNSSINFVIRFWVKFQKQTDFLAAQSEAVMKIHAAYDANDITIPFPIRTLDFGIKGGEKLSEMLVDSDNHPKE